MRRYSHNLLTHFYGPQNIYRSIWTFTSSFTDWSLQSLYLWMLLPWTRPLLDLQWVTVYLDPCRTRNRYVHTLGSGYVLIALHTFTERWFCLRSLLHTLHRSSTFEQLVLNYWTIWTAELLNYWTIWTAELLNYWTIELFEQLNFWTLELMKHIELMGLITYQHVLLKIIFITFCLSNTL